MGAILGTHVHDVASGINMIDFENAQPGTDEERQIYDSVEAVLGKSGAVLEQLTRYKGCEDAIKKAITTPNPTNEEAAWNTVVPVVDTLREFYEFSLELEACFPKLLIALCKSAPKQAVASQQALAKQLAHVFNFVLRFDEMKIVNPSIQNDFSYYRRTLNRMKMTKKDLNLTIRDELANRMSLFYAYPTPMMNVINETTVKFLSQNNVPRENVTTVLAVLANVCEDMYRTNKIQSEQTIMFVLRTMTGCIILYDQLHDLGAFNRKSPIKIRNCIMAVKTYQGGGPTKGLLNSLKYSTKHLNGPETPSNIKAMFD